MVLAILAAAFSVLDFGAKGDGRVKDTVAIQSAIDAAEKAGGGTVVLPRGRFVSGSLYLKDNVELHLDWGATLLASPDKADYNPAGVCQQNSASSRDHQSGGHLVLAIEKKNVAITGEGRIDGNCAKFVCREDGTNYPMDFEAWDNHIPWRPGQMVYFVECTGVRLKDVSLIDSPYWTCFLHGCEDVMVENVRIRTRREPMHVHNGDGLDIDCCRNVTVTGCDIDTSDDAITFRADGQRLRRVRPCEKVRVTNCRLSSACNAIRFGVGCGLIRDVALDGIEIRDTRVALNVVSSYSGESGVDFEDLSLSNLDVEAKVLFKIQPGYAKSARLKNLRVVRVRGKVTTDSIVEGIAGKPFGPILLKDVQIDTGLYATNLLGLTIEGSCLHRTDRKPKMPTIGGTVRGGTFFGGTVYLPARGLCAHQGAHAKLGVQGNSAVALAQAARDGVEMVEFDLVRLGTELYGLQHDPSQKVVTTFDQALDVLPDGGILINVHCYGDRQQMQEIARILKRRGRLHQAFICSDLRNIDDARVAVPEIAACNIERPGPRDRDWTDAENQKFIDDSVAHKCQYLQLCRPWPKHWSDRAHAAGIKVLYFKSDRSEEFAGLFDRGIDFIMTDSVVGREWAK